MRACIIFVASICLFYSFFVRAQTSDKISLATYYPVPHGVYSSLRLFPTDTIDPDQPCADEGLIFFHETEKQAYVCDGVKWNPLAGGGTRLYDDLHSMQDCLDLGGIIISDKAGILFCRFDAPYSFSSPMFSHCPLGWKEYENWSETVSVEGCCCSPRNLSEEGSCDTSSCAVFPAGSSVSGGHEWANVPVETASMNCPSSSSHFNANTTAIGCY